MRTITNFERINNPFKGVNNRSPSETIPDQATSPQELLRRYVHNEPLGLADGLIFDEDGSEPFPELYKMDKMDRLHFMQTNKEKIADLKEEISAGLRKAEAERMEKRRQTDVVKEQTSDDIQKASAEKPAD